MDEKQRLLKREIIGAERETDVSFQESCKDFSKILKANE